MSERHFLIVLLALGLVFSLFGWRLETPAAYDPLGPKAVPVGLGLVLAGLSLASLPAARGEAAILTARAGRLILVVLLYFLVFRLLGFMPATVVSVYLIARLRGANWMQGLLTGLMLALFFYGVFHFLLDVPLPLGRIFGVAG